MEDFDVFTDEINYTKPFYYDTLNKYVKELPGTPCGANYQSGKKLLADDCLAANDEANCAFNLSESMAASLRTLTVYRDEQLRVANDKKYKIQQYIKPTKDLIDKNPVSQDEEEWLKSLTATTSVDDITKLLKTCDIEDELPFHKKYLKFSKENNFENFQRILKELPREWTIVQLTVPYNPNENLLPLSDFRTDITSIYLSVLTNDYIQNDVPVTVHIPANPTKEGLQPLFTELFSLLDENYKTIENAQFLNNKRLVQNYWNRREDIDLRMKGVINMMDKEWLGGFGSLLTGKLVETGLKEKVVRVVDDTISDWGFIKLTSKQRILLYNLIESCPNMTSNQIKSCIRKILTENGNSEELRKVLNPCNICTKEFKLPNELCLKCLSKCFEVIHHFTLVDGIKAFSQAAMKVREDDEFAGLKKALRHPVILIVDEMLDTFPWETLPILNHHPVSRIESIHFAYYLYKVHENSIQDGYFNTTAEVGRYIINPERNLDRMELRMTSFLKYWCGAWRGHAGAERGEGEEGGKGAAGDFVRYCTEADVFSLLRARRRRAADARVGRRDVHAVSPCCRYICICVCSYCGHGDGGPLTHVSGGVTSRCVAVLYCGHGDGGPLTHVSGGVTSRCVAVLSGCGSARLSAHAPRRAATRQRLADSPLIVGMLWEVTDLEVDKMVSTLLALFVPSAAHVPWSAVGKAGWSRGVLDTTVETKVPFSPEPDLLRAICRARGSTNYLLIASSLIARGLPVRCTRQSLEVKS